MNPFLIWTIGAFVIYGSLRLIRPNAPTHHNLLPALFWPVGVGVLAIGLVVCVPWMAIRGVQYVSQVSPSRRHETVRKAIQDVPPVSAPTHEGDGTRVRRK